MKMGGATPEDGSSQRDQTPQEEQDARKAQLKYTDKQIDETLDKTMDANKKLVIRAFEEHIEKLEKLKIAIKEDMSDGASQTLRPIDCMEFSLRLVTSP